MRVSAIDNGTYKIRGEGSASDARMESCYYTVSTACRINLVFATGALSVEYCFRMHTTYMPAREDSIDITDLVAQKDYSDEIDQMLVYADQALLVVNKPTKLLSVRHSPLPSLHDYFGRDAFLESLEILQSAAGESCNPSPELETRHLQFN